MPDDDLQRLSQVLDAADAAHGDDINALAGLDADQVGYLAAAGDIEDPDTDGLEMDRCP